MNRPPFRHVKVKGDIKILTTCMVHITLRLSNILFSPLWKPRLSRCTVYMFVLNLNSIIETEGPSVYLVVNNPIRPRGRGRALLFSKGMRFPCSSFGTLYFVLCVLALSLLRTGFILGGYKPNPFSRLVEITSIAHH